MAITSDSGFFTLGNSSAATQLHGLPSGGTTGQVIGKLSANDYDFSWITNPANDFTPVYPQIMARVSLRF